MASTWQKAFQRIFWKNRPNTTTPLGESKLLPMDAAIDEIDDRVVTLRTTKAEQSDFLTAIKSISFDRSTGIFTITKFNDTTTTIDTDLEKIAVNFDYDDDPTSEHYQNLILTLIDGTIKYIDISALITQYEFTNSATIHFSVSASGEISASLVNGSITTSHLAPEVMATINQKTAQAETYSEESEAWAKGTKSGTPVSSSDEQYENNAKYYSEESEDFSIDSEAWAKGTRNGTAVVSGDDTYHNNSKYYSEKADGFSEDSEAWAVGKRDGTDVPSTDPTYHNNAKHWAEQAEILSHGSAGNISYDNTSSEVDAEEVQGAIDELANPEFTEASTRANIASGESFKTLFGKIKKFFTDLKTVAFTGSYNDLSDKPTIPAAQVNSNWNATSGVAQILNKPTIPTKTSQLTNDSGFLTSHQDISGKLNKSGDTMTGTLLVGTDAGAAPASTPMAIAYGRIQCYGTLLINGNTDNSGTEYVIITAGKGLSSTVDDGLAIGASTLQWQGQTVIHSGNIGSQSVNYANSAGSVTNYGRSELKFKMKSDGTTYSFVCLGFGNYTIDFSDKLDKSGDYMRGNLYIGSSGAGGYLNGSATNGGCNSIFIGDDVWLGDVNAGGILGMKSIGTSCGIRLLNSSGTVIGNLYSDGSNLNVDRNFRLSGTNQAQFGDDTIFINRDNSSWLNLRAGNGIVYRGQWHDFKNPAASAWVSISAGGFVTQSSKRYKENIKDITDEDAKKLLDVRAVSFDYKDGVRDKDRNKYNQHGVIAEEVDEILPEVVTYAPLVREDPESELVPDGVDYAKFVPYLIKMVQIQQKEIDELKAIVKELQTKME